MPGCGTKKLNMKKNIYLKEKHRKDVVSSMAKKLAVPDESIVYRDSGKKESGWKIILVSLFVCTVFFVMYMVFTSQKKALPAAEVVTENTPDCPILRISASYDRGEINVNEFAGYLANVLVKYDSLPKKFRVEHPVIRPDEIFGMLNNAWPRIRPDLRDSLIQNFTQLQENKQSKPENSRFPHTDGQFK